jgi:hypothetical protein
MKRRSFFQTVTAFLGFFFGNRALALETLWPKRGERVLSLEAPKAPKPVTRSSVKRVGPWMRLVEPRVLTIEATPIGSIQELETLRRAGKIERQEGLEIAHLMNPARNRRFNIADDVLYRAELGRLHEDDELPAA